MPAVRGTAVIVTSRTGLPEHLVDPLDEPLVAARLRGFREARPHLEHVIVRQGDPADAQAGAPDLAQLPLDPVPHHTRADRLRHGEAEAGLTGLLGAREPVERQEARRDRTALAVHGVEIARA